MAFETEICHYSHPTPVTRQPALAGMSDVVLLSESVGIILWEVVGTLISKNRVRCAEMNRW